MDEMSDKVSSRQAAIRGDVPIVPGTTEFASGPEEIRAFGEEFGWPVCIKAAFGGGGRGMKVVQSAGEVDDAMASAQREAKSFFGRDEVYVERYLTWPRHVEVQLVGDKHGNVVWISTRDCSAQRRHQKLIEEAPAPGLAPGIEEAMGEAAVKAAKAVGYVGAGTVEFIYQDEQFFFLEMNTRLQVEHPVSEMITDIDLVEWQIRVAAGEALPMTQDEVNASRRGHSIEVRINAEDPTDGKFLPSPGPITKLIAPDGFGVRFDTGYLSGDSISQYYDNLVGKLIVWGRDRDVAIARTIRALEEMTVEGVATTIPADLADPAPPRLRRRRAFDQVGRGTPRPQRHRSPGPPRDRPATTMSGAARQALDHGRGERQAFRRRDVGAGAWPPSPWAPHRPRRQKRGPSAAGAAAPGPGSIEAPMQGTIVKVLVEVGQVVESGVGIVVLEAMKMENQINADKAGTVKEIRVAAGDTVGGGDVLAVIE